MDFHFFLHFFHAKPLELCNTGCLLCFALLSSLLFMVNYFLPHHSGLREASSILKKKKELHKRMLTATKYENIMKLGNQNSLKNNLQILTLITSLMMIA